MAKPTRKQILAVQGVLYNRKRLRELSDHHASIGKLMNLDPSARLASGDIRSPAGSGPNWLYADGRVDQLVIQAAGRCDRIAATLLQTRAELSALSIPRGDKRHLMAALQAEAAAWSARATVWRAPTRPNDPHKLAVTITSHLATALAEQQHVKQYLKPRSQVPK